MEKSEKKLTEHDIVSWFKAHPSQWLEIPELRGIIENPEQRSKTDGPTSLADFQLRRLKQENTKLQTQLQTLVSVAQTNEKLMRRLHALSLDWASASSFGAFVAQFCSQLEAEFGADAVCLHLESVPEGLEGDESIVALDKKALDWLMTQQPAEPQCGRFTQAKLNQLFPTSQAQIQSAAVVVLESGGWLAIGSTDEAKFQPDMGTLFVELLANAICHQLTRLTDGA